MAHAKQLKSGSWRVQVYAGKDENGKNMYKSFTASTERKANLAAMEWQEHYKQIESDNTNMTLDEAMQKYINMKNNILSPATIRGYENIRKNKFKAIMQKRLNRISQQDIQRAINTEAEKSSAKTIANQYGLLSAVLHEYRPDFNIKITLPQKVPYEAHTLDGEQIAKLLNVIQGDEAEIPILLAVWMGLRRSELLGLKWDCIDTKKRILTVKAALVPDKDNNMVEKGPKSVKSNRKIRIPIYINEKLKATGKGNDHVVTLAGDTIRKRLQRFCVKAGIPKVRLHDLRHTMASVGALLNIGDKYMMERGGWSNSATMKNIYQHTIESEKHTVDDEIDNYFLNLIKGKVPSGS